MTRGAATTFASYDGTSLACTSEGSGPVLLCLPGGPGRAGAYLEDLAGLTATRTVVVLDSRATGRSEVPSDPASLRFDRLADDVEALRTHLGLETVDVLGHSAGTIVAQTWASRYPDRVRSLVLVTPSGRLQGGDRGDVAAIRAARSDEPWYADAAEAQQALDEGAPPAQQQALVRATRPFFYGRWDERTQAHAATADRQSSKRAELGFAAGIEDVDVAGLLAGLRQVTAPVLVVGGGRDALTGVDAVHAVAGSFPSAETVVLPEAGHFPWVDAPEAFAAVVGEWLAARAGQRPGSGPL
ncbi:MAG: Alpha/beta hydrolase fold protein [Frankiales bacterium]|nr:Alpha/beta hydrolase fold protein [Frankiales bacterium]